MNRRRRAASIAEADQNMVSVLESLDGAKRYRDWILQLALPHIPLDSTTLEMGAGRGTFTDELSRHALVVATEIGPEALSHLRKKYANSDRVTVSTRELSDTESNAFDSAFLCNVLEHIEDDDAALEELFRVVRPGGTVIVFSPAFRFLFSEFDRQVGHYHRYRLKSIRRKFQNSDYQVIEARYVNFVGFFSWLLIVRLLRLSPSKGKLIQVFDRFVVPWLQALESRVRPPFGQSVFVVGRVSDKAVD